MTDLNTYLDANTAPAPRADLNARILAAAQSAQPANDLPTRRPWWAMGGVAALAVMGALFFVQPSVIEDEAADAEWSQLAENSGFADLYEWVEGETLDTDG